MLLNEKAISSAWDKSRFDFGMNFGCHGFNTFRQMIINYEAAKTPETFPIVNKTPENSEFVKNDTDREYSHADQPIGYPNCPVCKTMRYTLDGVEGMGICGDCRLSLILPIHKPETQQPVESPDYECAVQGLSVSRALLMESFPDDTIHQKVVGLMSLLQLNAERVVEKATKREAVCRYKTAYEAYHFYVHASDEELSDKGITRTDALKAANQADIDLLEQGRRG